MRNRDKATPPTDHLTAAAHRNETTPRQSRRKRNPYLEVLRTYGRWRFLVLGLAAPAMTAFELRKASDKMDLVAFLIPYWGMAGQLVLHLRDVFGGPRLRLTPRVYRAHFVVAGALVGLFVILIPVGLSWIILGASSAYLAITAEGLAAFAVACFGYQFPRAGYLLLFIAYAGAAVYWSYIGDVERSLPMVPALLLLASAILLLIAVAIRFTSASEETASDRSALEWAGRMTARAILSAGGRRTLVGSWDRRMLRSLGGGGLAHEEGLLRRAGHWNAAWGLTSRGIWVGVFVGVLLLTLRFWLGRLDSDLWAAFLIFLPFAASLPAVTFGEPQDRGLLPYEFLRPYSRRQHVHAVGLVAAGSVATILVLTIGIPVIGNWVLGSPLFPPAAWRGVIAYGVWTPIFFGISTANLDREESLTALIFSLIVYLLYLLIVGTTLASWPNAALGVVACVVSVVGLIIVRAAYRSWLDRDLC